MNNSTETSSESFDEISGIPQENDNNIPKWKLLICKIIRLQPNTNIGGRRTLSKRQKKELIRKKEEFFITSAQELIANNTSDSFFIDSSRKLLVQQRIQDDTKARRRLEKWARNTIIVYLFIVFALVILNGLSQIIWNEYFKEHGFITDTVMTVILSTTTINIIGLGVIVLRGHFPNYNHDENSDFPAQSQNHSQID